MPFDGIDLLTLTVLIEILESIALFLATDTLCGPPSHLVPLLLLNHSINTRLSADGNPHFYALIFARKFDLETARRRLGDASISSKALTEEMKRRFLVLSRLRSRKDCLADSKRTESSSLDGLLATAYLMMLENQGKNKMQLLDYAHLGQWINDYLLHDQGASLTRSSLQNGGYPTPTTSTSFAMWLFWFFLRPDEYSHNVKGFQSTLNVLKTLAFSAHLYKLTIIPWLEHSPSQELEPATTITWYSRPLPISPPPMAVPAILSFLALVNRRKSLPIAPSDPTITLSLSNDELDAEWGRALASRTKEITDCFALGSVEGVWEGFFTYTEFTAYAAMLRGGPPQEIQNSVIGRHQQTWKLREWHLVQASSATTVEPLHPGDPLRSYFPSGATLTVTENGLMVREPGRLDPLVYCKPGTRSGKVVDVIITGEGHSAWGQFSLTGRVRPCDGFVTVSKDYVDDDRGKWVYRGYLVGNRNGNLVGRWRDTLSSIHHHGYEGCFAMGRRR